MEMMAISKAYQAAVMLTGDEARAEAAVLRGMETVDCGAPLEEGLMRATVAASVVGGIEDAGAWPGVGVEMPAEMARVMRLASGLRRAFVVRVLLGYSREESARLLGVGAAELAEMVGRAARVLAGEGGWTWIPASECASCGPSIRAL